MSDASDELPADLARLLREAWRGREPLHADPEQTAYRLFHGHGDGCPGLDVDRLGETAVVSHSLALTSRLDEVVAALDDCLAPTRIVAKPQRGEPSLLRGTSEPAEIEVLDNGLTFLVEPLARRNAGLYLDARPARRWILEHSAGRRVLNLFAYTGGLGLAAAAGQARWVRHLELQKRQVGRIRRNLERNGLPVDDRNLVREDLYKHLRRAGRKEVAVDAIVLDPPPKVPARGSHAPPGQDFETLAPLCTALLAPGGWLLCFFHRRDVPRERYEAQVFEASPRPLQVLWRGTSGDDFPEADPEAKLRFTAFELA